MTIKYLKTDRKHFDARAHGSRCAECPLKFREPVGPEVCASAKLIIVGDFPGSAENKCGVPFSGAVGDQLQRWFGSLGVYRKDIHLTNAVLCRPPRERMSGDEWKQAIACCAPRLAREISVLHQRKSIIAFGDRALQALTGRQKIKPWAGGPVQSDKWGAIVIPSWHPFFALKKPHYMPVVKWFLARAIAFSNGTLSLWQWPRLVTEPPYEQALLELSRENAISLDIENAPNLGRIRCIGVGVDRLAVSVPLAPEGAASERELAILRAIIAGPALKILQNGQHDRHTLEADGYVVSGPFYDTMFAHTVVAPRLPHGLGFIAGTETHAECWKSEFHEADEKEVGRNSWFDKAPLSELLPYNCKDNVQQYNIYKSLNEKLDRTHNGQQLFAELTELDEIAYKMRTRGMFVSDKNREKHRIGMQAACEKFREEFRTIITEEEFALGKNGQNPSLARLFFERLKAPPVSYSETTGKPSLDVTALNTYVGYFTEAGAPQIAQLARLILKYRQLTKLLQSYVLTLPVGTDGAVHPHWRAGKARTGRWAAKDPALQTIPKVKRRNDGSEIPGLRDLFCARPGFYLVKADYSQLELRIMALLSGDPGLLAAYAEGRDVHQMTADAAFKCKANKAQRDRAKQVNYSLLYGAGDETIWKRLVVDIPDLRKEHVAHLRNTFFTLFPQVTSWQKQLIHNSEVNGYVEAPISGRRQYYCDGRIVPTEILNFPIQATAGDLANLALRTIAAKIDWERNHILTQVHDEVMLECRNAEEGLELLKAGMQQEVTLNGGKIVFPVDCSVGTNWGRCIAEPKWKWLKYKFLPLLESLHCETPSADAVPSRMRQSFDT